MQKFFVVPQTQVNQGLTKSRDGGSGGDWPRPPSVSGPSTSYTYILGIELFTNPRRYVNTLRIKKIPSNSQIRNYCRLEKEVGMYIIILKFITHQFIRQVKVNDIRYERLYLINSVRTSLNILQKGQIKMDSYL